MSHSEIVSTGLNRIQRLAHLRRLPRLGRIRLGERRLLRRNNRSVQVPVELGWFKFDAESLRSYPAIRELYGDRPKELDILLPVEDPRLFFPQACKLYGKGGALKCKGDGRRAERWLCDKCGQMACDCTGAPKSLAEIECPCELLERRDCRFIGSLMVILPRVSCAGVWQVDTSSAYSIVSINSDVDYIRSLCGRVAHVPLTLRRLPRPEGTQCGRRVGHSLKITFDLGMEQLQQIQRGVMPSQEAESRGGAETRRGWVTDETATAHDF